MTKVYLVTAGDYEDYYVEAVFSMKDVAMQYMKTLNTGVAIEEKTVIEFELDAWNKQNGWKDGKHECITIYSFLEELRKAGDEKKI